MSSPKPTPRNQSGFTYIGLLILIAIMGVTLAGVGTVWRTTQQRFRENQLLFVGNQFSKAITAYYLNSPGGIRQFPKKLEELLQDKRYPNTERYLRKLFADPITGSNEWGLIKAADGSIVGVYSLSELTPIKTDNFARGNEGFANKKHYSEWQFTYRPERYSPIVATAAPANSTAGSTAAGTTILGNAILGNTIPGSPNSGSPATGNTSVTSETPTGVQPLPPPLPLPSKVAPQVTPRVANYCLLTFNTDVVNCLHNADKFGEAAGVTCMASANARYTACMNTDPGVSMPILDIQYQ